jgi:hypothetical protein
MHLSRAEAFHIKRPKVRNRRPVNSFGVDYIVTF